MNCKPGDLAIVVAGKMNRGKVITCLREASVSEVADSLGGFPGMVGPFWQVDRELDWGIGGLPLCSARFAPDSALRPLNADEGDDETLAWAGKPIDHEVTA